MNDETKRTNKNDLVLAEIKKLKLQFNHANSYEEKIVIFKKALSYGDIGNDWLLDIFTTANNEIKWLSGLILLDAENEVYRELLLEYFADFIPNNVSQWNKYKQEFSDLIINLSEINLSKTKLIKINFSKVNLNKANLRGVDFTQANLNRASLRKANLRAALLNESDLIETDFSEANLEEVTFVSTNLYKSNLEYTKLSWVTFYASVILDQTNVRNAKVNEIDFRFDNIIQNMIFYSDTALEKVTFGEDLKFKNVTFSGTNLEDAYFLGSSFENVIFDNCNLTNADFSWFYCETSERELVFRKCNLENAKFKFMESFKGLVFEEVNLKGTDFRWSDITNIDFTGLDVRGANFTRCSFDNNSLERANTEGAKFSSIDKPTRGHLRSFPLFPKYIMNPDKLKGALFSNEYYYEPGYE